METEAPEKETQQKQTDKDGNVITPETDENGNVVDYLLCSNTADLRNFPASAYYYTNRQLIRIIGWND